MGNKKIIITLLLAVILILAAGICIFIPRMSKTNQKEDSEKEISFVDEEDSEDEIKYADVSEAVVGNRVYLGDFEGELSWDVVEEQDGKLMLVATNCIAQRAYHNKAKAVTWQKSEIRKWLNGTFYKKAFSQDEKAIIQKTHVVNAKNNFFGTKGGQDTDDHVFLLSIDEIDKYYVETPTRMATLRDGATIWWWLRSPGFQEHAAANIGDYGNLNMAGHKVFDSYVVKGGVRPAMWVNQ